MRRLKSRIDALEASRRGDIDRPEKIMLVGILGRRDALFWPWRINSTSRTPICEIRRRQREYLDGAVGITAKADGRQQWKDAHAMRQRLIGAGMITAVHSGGQVQSVFLTAQGEATARALVGDRLHTMETGQLILAYLRIKSEQTPVRAVRESVLLNRDCTGDPESWNAATEMVLPLLTSGIVTCHSDTQGRACYTPEPGKRTDLVENLPPSDSGDADPHPDFDDCYIEAFNDERQVLQNAEPRDPSEIFVPLPATGWGWPCHFPQEAER